jgi:hypothetical protein
MIVLNRNFYQATDWALPSMYVGTGSFKGKNSEQVFTAGGFREINSIELSIPPSGLLLRKTPSC